MDLGGGMAVNALEHIDEVVVGLMPCSRQVTSRLGRIPMYLAPTSVQQRVAWQPGFLGQCRLGPGAEAFHHGPGMREAVAVRGLAPGSGPGQALEPVIAKARFDPVERTARIACLPHRRGRGVRGFGELPAGVRPPWGVGQPGLLGIAAVGVVAVAQPHRALGWRATQRLLDRLGRP